MSIICRSFSVFCRFCNLMDFILFSLTHKFTCGLSCTSFFQYILIRSFLRQDIIEIASALAVICLTLYLNFCFFLHYIQLESWTVLLINHGLVELLHWRFPCCCVDSCVNLIILAGNLNYFIASDCCSQFMKWEICFLNIFCQIFRCPQYLINCSDVQENFISWRCSSSERKRSGSWISIFCHSFRVKAI